MLFSQIAKARQILIYGYGLEGKAAENFLRRNFGMINIEIFDKNIARFSLPQQLEDFDIIVVSPGVDRKIFAKELQSKLTSGTEIFFNNLSDDQRFKIIGISGTKGKSTTTKFCDDLLNFADFKSVAAGNFGRPLLDVFEELDKLDFVVAELSSYQLENLEVSPHFALFTDFYLDHLDRHGTLDAYFKAKSNLFIHQELGDYIITTKAANKFLEPGKSWFKQNADKVIFAEPLIKEYFDIDSVFRAPHWLRNFGIAYELSQIIGVSQQRFNEFCKKFSGLEHRLEYFSNRNGIKWINDANATTPDAVVSALEYFNREVGTLVLGGQDRGYNFDELISKILEIGPFLIILDSESGYRIREILVRLDYQYYCIVKNMKEIVEKCFEYTPPGKVCLLSMGSPSYGYWKNFEEKGKMFKEMVEKYNYGK